MANVAKPAVQTAENSTQQVTVIETSTQDGWKQDSDESFNKSETLFSKVSTIIITVIGVSIMGHIFNFLSNLSGSRSSGGTQRAKEIDYNKKRTIVDVEGAENMSKATTAKALEENAVLYDTATILAVDYTKIAASSLPIKQNQWLCLEMSSFNEVDNIINWVSNVSKKANHKNIFILPRVVFVNPRNFSRRDIAKASYLLSEQGIELERFSAGCHTLNDAVRVFEKSLGRENTDNFQPWLEQFNENQVALSRR
jgi:hypothetical protein